MGAFNDDAFADLSDDFNQKRGTPTPPKPSALALVHGRILTSAFTDLSLILPATTSRFVAGYFPVAPIIAAKPKATLTLKTKVALPPVTARRAASAFGAAKPAIIVADNLTSRFVPAAKAKAVTEAPKARTTLRLNKQVELPPTTARVSRRSSGEEFAAAFKAEMARMQAGAAETTKRNRYSGKSWKELIAEAEKGPQPSRDFANIDLAAAFKQEMKQMLAQEEPTPATKPAEPRRTMGQKLAA